MVTLRFYPQIQRQVHDWQLLIEINKNGALVFVLVTATYRSVSIV